MRIFLAGISRGYAQVALNPGHPDGDGVKKLGGVMGGPSIYLAQPTLWWRLA